MLIEEIAFILLVILVLWLLWRANGNRDHDKWFDEEF
jgi:ABC-type nickel/cobalt efflux system permease component RcnA